MHGSQSTAKSSRELKVLTNFNVPARIHRGVLVLDHRPFLALLAVLQFDDHKTAAKLFPVQGEFNFPALQLCYGVYRAHLKCPPVPHHHRARTVTTLGNIALEVGIVQRVIFGLNRQALVVRIQPRAFRHGPRFQRALNRQTKIVMQPARSVFLYHEGIFCFGGTLHAGRLRCAVELPLPLVLFQFRNLRHGRILSHPFLQVLEVLF